MTCVTNSGITHLGLAIFGSVAIVVVGSVLALLIWRGVGK